MIEDEIAHYLRLTYDFPEEIRLDVIVTGPETFQATLVNPDGSAKAIDGSFKKSVGGSFMIAPLEQPDLSLEQLQVFDTIARDFAEKISKGEEAGSKIIQLVQEGEFPELFDALGDRPNIAGSVKEGMLPVWHSLDNMLTMRGYQLSKRHPQESVPASIWITKRESRFQF